MDRHARAIGDDDALLAEDLGAVVPAGSALPTRVDAHNVSIELVVANLGRHWHVRAQPAVDRGPGGLQFLTHPVNGEGAISVTMNTRQWFIVASRRRRRCLFQGDRSPFSAEHPLDDPDLGCNLSTRPTLPLSQFTNTATRASQRPTGRSHLDKFRTPHTDCAL